MTKHPSALPHGTIDEVFPDVFVVRGRFKPGPAVHFDRNMTIVRTGKELVAINSVRLSDEGEAALAKLGKLAHVIRLGALHGADDPYFVERFGATLWGLPRMEHRSVAKVLTNEDTPLGAKVFPFPSGKKSEGALLLPVGDGVLVTCDAFQNWTTFEHCSWVARRVVKVMGFGPAMVGAKPWIKAMGVDVRADLEHLVAQRFRHLIPGHGTVLRDEAQAKLGLAITARFASR